MSTHLQPSFWYNQLRSTNVLKKIKNSDPSKCTLICTVWWNPKFSCSAIPLAVKNHLSHCGHSIHSTCLSVSHMTNETNCRGICCWCLNNLFYLEMVLEYMSNAIGRQLLMVQSLMEPSSGTYSIVPSWL